MFRLTGCVAVVTGGSRNLGYDLALALAEAGADVVITSRKLSDAKTAATDIAAATGRRILPLVCDIQNEKSVQTMVRAALRQFGRIDILVNNAGNVISTRETASFEKRSLKEWQHTLDINLTGVFLCVKHVFNQAMDPASRGVIVNIGSTAGIIGKDRRVYRGTQLGGVTLDYEAAKAGVINMTRDLAVQLAPKGIRVNCISPGGFFRNQDPRFVRAYGRTIPMGRMGREGKELKGVVVFLASEASSYITGHNLVVDGGMTAW